MKKSYHSKTVPSDEATMTSRSRLPSTTYSELPGSTAPADDSTTASLIPFPPVDAGRRLGRAPGSGKQARASAVLQPGRRILPVAAVERRRVDDQASDRIERIQIDAPRLRVRARLV